MENMEKKENKIQSMEIKKEVEGGTFSPQSVAIKVDNQTSNTIQSIIVEENVKQFDFSPVAGTITITTAASSLYHRENQLIKDKENYLQKLADTVKDKLKSKSK